MKRTAKRFIASFCTATLLLLSCSFFAFAAPQSTDDLLLSKGVPQDIVNQLPEKQKDLIMRTLPDDAQFESFEKREYPAEDSNTGIRPMSDTIPDSELTLSVMAFSITYNGTPCYSIYPSFVWDSYVKLKNDSFSMALYPGWEAIPGKNNLEVWVRNVQGDPVQHTSVDAAVSNYYGYSYKIPSNVGSLQGGYEGHAYLYAIKKSSTATHAISLNYADDTSWLFSASYSISIGPASINVTGDDSNIRFKSGNFYF